MAREGADGFLMVVVAAIVIVVFLAMAFVQKVADIFGVDYETAKVLVWSLSILIAVSVGVAAGFSYFLGAGKKESYGFLLPFILGGLVICFFPVVDYRVASDGSFFYHYPFWARGFAKAFYVFVAAGIGHAVGKILRKD